MVLQTMVFPEKEELSKLYYRGSKAVQLNSNYLYIPKGEVVSSDTYMNIFDMKTWKKYTKLSQPLFTMNFFGQGKVKIICEVEEGKKQILHTFIKEEQTEQYLEYELPKELKEGFVYFEIEAFSDLKLYKAVFSTKEAELQKIKLAIVICTYKRQKELERTIATIKEQKEFLEEEWIDITIIDNASELKNKYGNHITVYHNKNTGGAGGFTRGMEEVVKNQNKFDATHVLLMDDDAQLQFESIIRLRALLTYVKKKHIEKAVAGRMFRLDNPWIQYTALEVWNKGSIRHIGGTVDMRLKSSLWTMNDNKGGMYGGWWFECYPIEFIKKQKPIPFFIHCDDVEYGLRHGKTPIILNGIQVWHENFEHRVKPTIVYYDVRNSLIVNSIWEKSYVTKRLWRMWARRAVWLVTRKNYAEEYMALLGIKDYLRGFSWLYQVDSEQYHKQLCNKTKFSWWETVILCITVWFEIISKYGKVKETYTNE